jgi:hypothetical protein
MPQSPNFTVRSAHVNVPLTQFSVGYHPLGMIAEQVFPVVPVSNESDYYYFWDKGQAFRVERSDGKGSLRADGTRPKLVDFGATLKTYTAEEFAMETRITDRERANADNALALEQSKVRRVQDLLYIDYEIRVASALTAAATYPAANVVTLSGTSQWNNASFSSQTGNQHSVIKANIEAGKEAIRKATGGLLPNTIVIPRAVAAVMYNDVGLADIVKYTAPNLMVDDLLPQTLWGMRVLIPTVPFTTSAEGEAPAMSDVWGKNVILLYRDPNPGLDALTLGLTLRQRPWQVKQYRDEQIDATFYRPGFVQVEQLVAPDCGYLLQNVIA